MKKALFKDSIKEIKNTYKRFLSILLMAFLGVGFFAGLRASSPDMVYTIDNFYDNQNVYDIEVLSTLGLTNDDIEALTKINGIEKVYGEYSKDVIVDDQNTEFVVKLMSFDDINKPILKNGNLPENIDECIVEESLLTRLQKQIGDKIQVTEVNSSDDESKMINQTEMKIVGTMQSPLYISRDKGTSKLGAGKVDYIVYCNKDNFSSDIYTEIYMTVNNAKEMITSKDDYKNSIEEVMDKIEQIKEERQTARYNSLINEATEKVNSAQADFDKEKSEAEQKIADAEQQIKDGKSEINSNENTINENEAKAKSEFDSAEEQIAQAKEELSKNEKEFETKKKEAENEIDNAEKLKNQTQEQLNTVNEQLKAIQEQYKKVIETLENGNIPEELKKQLESQKLQLETTITGLQNTKGQIEAGIKTINDEIEAGKKELQSAEQKLKDAKDEISKNEEKLQKTKTDTYTQIQSARKSLKTAKAELKNAEEELEKNKKEFDEKIRDAEQKLIDARQKISEIENPEWYILDRNSNMSYNSYVQDVENIENIATVFPIVFFIVATLISLTSMTRMVEEQRVQIGTLKALGYNKMQIASKYLIYASLACIIGGVVGMCIGFVTLPRIIWLMYSMMYTIDEFIIKFDWVDGGIGLILINICILGATLITVLKELKYMPSELMRPKAPKIGKRVLLERIPFIWRRLSFTRKVTIRNIFRYKKRFLMTIFGICGCTALILTGFGLRDSVTRILSDQYGRINKYDMQITLKTSLENDQKERFIQDLKTKEQIQDVVEVNISAGKLNNIANKDIPDEQKVNNEEEIQIIVPKESSEISKVINILDSKTKEEVNLESGKIYITQKVSQLINVKKGDTLLLKNKDDIEKEVEIGGIVENYIYHYAYMTKDTYEGLYEEYTTNTISITNKEDTSEEELDNLSREILERSEVASAIRTDVIEGMMDDMMSSLNYVVVVLIISAGLLAFVVLYNLAYVNMSERIRELATIKVLGFYDKEVYSYVTRETILLTIMGIILGLVLGYFLNIFVLSTCELNMLKFSTEINFVSYIYSIVITWVFTMIVNYATYFALKKIDMIESLKSIE